MAVPGLNHFKIRSTDLDRSIDFYERVLGLRVGERPAFDFPGARLTAFGVPFRKSQVPTNRQIELLVSDPDGLQLELLFAP